MFGASAGANRSPPTESENKNVNNTNPVVLTSFQPDFARKSTILSILIFKLIKNH